MSWLGFVFEGMVGWKSTLLKGKKWGELPSLLRSCYLSRNLLWRGSAAGAICSLLRNAYINYQMNPTGARFRQLRFWFIVHIIWHKKANATSRTATAEGWVISENKGVADMPSSKSAPDIWSPPIKICMSSMLNSINPWQHCILEAPCNSRPSPEKRWDGPGKARRRETGTGKGVEELLRQRELSCLWPLSLGRRQKNTTGVLGDKSGIEDWRGNVIVQKLLFLQNKWGLFFFSGST